MSNTLVTISPTKLYSVFELPIDLFVPGRICLFGEHSDWCASYTNEPGLAITVCPELGIFGQVQRVANHKRLFIYLTVHETTTAISPLDPEYLKMRAKDKSNFFAYVDGAASAFLTKYPWTSFDSVIISNYRTTLPIKKGVSSSASISVLVIRALSVTLFGKRLPPKEEAELAYEGERLTGSLCGKLDQISAIINPGEVALLGFHPVGLEKNIEMRVEEIIRVGSPVHLILVNVKGKKDTIKILSSLQEVAADENQLVRQLFGKMNNKTVLEAKRLLELGNQLTLLGNLAKVAQKNFDEIAAPSCPSELTAPNLHLVLEDPEVKRLALGGKAKKNITEQNPETKKKGQIPIL